MNKFKILLVLLVGFFSVDCQSQTTKTSQAPIYGEAFATKNSLAATKLPQVLGTKDSVAVKVTGQVVDVCQAKGCWLDVKLTDNTVMKVRFKDYGFFVPKNIAGKTVVLNGVAYNKSISVADQQHYAQDAGKSVAEIKAITQPQKSITFTATGVVVQ
ncbi:DUF4920 domain-containing protein [Adhaeribacter rhizoryzae]|uniref:DUF4920 domain-containing protein n=1 Tax=Adhaeribacter rhizoryzae TaxID=2607907 RepID=A0A5M6DAR8_9BACT|nr:DUF4920 domain-containing protein [Adhaeribacter rhizoryzae]KAA5543500.1 DUF4920 domain-containing protein [Adhaeribacter rhizoryzae]